MNEQEAGTESSPEEPRKEPSESISAAEPSQPAAPDDDERDLQEGQSGDALAWLEGPAFDSPIEEMPTLQWPDVEAEAEIAEGNQVGPEPSSAAGAENAADDELDDLEDAMLYLEHLAEQQGTPIDDMPTLVSGGDSEQDYSADAAARAAEDLGDTSPPPTLDSDPMAWLEQLAIDQDSPLEELPSVANRLLASEIVSQYDADARGESAEAALPSQVLELDIALQYLEEQAKAQGISLDDVSFDETEEDESFADDLDALDQMAVVTAAAVVKRHDSDSVVESNAPIVEAAQVDEDAPIAAEAEPIETELIAADETSSLAEDPAVIASEEGEWDDLSEQIPDDPDAALAWLGALAAEEDSPESNGDKSVLAKGAAAVTVGKLLHADEEEPQESQDEIGQPADGQGAGLVNLEEMPDDPDEAMAWMEGLAGQAEEVPAEQMTPGLADSHPALSAPVLSEGELAQGVDSDLARAALLAGNAAAAMRQYRTMLDEGQGGAALIADLEAAVSEHPDEPELVQLLGDAYMQDGQVQKAMKTYNKEFDHL